MLEHGGYSFNGNGLLGAFGTRSQSTKGMRKIAVSFTVANEFTI
jgi:hypothetical protein